MMWFYHVKLKGHEKNPSLVKGIWADSDSHLAKFFAKYKLNEVVESFEVFSEGTESYSKGKMSCYISLDPYGKVRSKTDEDAVKWWSRQSAQTIKPEHNIYALFYEEDEYVVTVNGEGFPVAPSLAICNHSPDGYAWGYYGSGPAQLALAVLLNETGDVPLVLEVYQEFKTFLIANVGVYSPKDKPFHFYSGDVQSFLKATQTKSRDTLLQWSGKLFERHK